ncbi:MAG: hypothetical protein RLO11_00155 [Salinisphaeraceae bacterium]
MNRTATRTSRAPDGCNASSLYLSLTPDERARVVSLATRDARSISATARLLRQLVLREAMETLGVDVHADMIQSRTG